MSVRLSRHAAERLVAARKARMMTQLEMSRASKISLRTIQMLESCKRDSFTESTLIHLCRALEVSLDDIIQPPSTPPEALSAESQTTRPDPEIAVRNEEVSTTLDKRRKAKSGVFPGTWKVLLGTALMVALVVGYYWNKVGYGKHIKNRNNTVDWVNYTPSRVCSVTPEFQVWKNFWVGGKAGMVFNRFEFRQATVVQDTLSGVLQWSYHYISARPNIYVNLFCEWEPDLEYCLFTGPVGGDSTIACSFKLRCPDKPGLYKVRAFYGLAARPVRNFFGSADLRSNYPQDHPKYVESKLVVMPRDYRGKLRFARGRGVVES